MALEALISIDSFYLGIFCFVASLLISFITFKVWELRVVFAAANTMFIGLSAGFLAFSVVAPLGLAILLVQMTRVINCLRIVKSRLPEQQTILRAKRTEIMLSLYMVVLILCGFAVTDITTTLVSVAVSLQLIVAALLLLRTRHMQSIMSATLPKKFMSPIDLPSVTVAIPARNQTTELTDCLQSVLKLNYPKLEILVLDDCSQDKTSDIIKTFAHRGVRFLEGVPPSSSWVAKNWAYQQLLDNASGEIILFCGTDVRFQPQSLRLLIELMKKQKFTMLSVLPIRELNFSAGMLVQPMRYYRQIVLPWQVNSNTPAIGTCWAMTRRTLIKHGGFKALRRSIRPEHVIAKGVAAKGNYSLVASIGGLGISSVKSFGAQWHTALRTRYPELKNRPESVVALIVMHTFAFIGPFVSLLYGIMTLHGLIILLSVITIGYLLLIHLYVTGLMHKNQRTIAILSYPSAVITELIVCVYSMWAYEFSEVIWKGRNVCMPVLRGNLTLPKL